MFGRLWIAIVAIVMGIGVLAGCGGGTVSDGGGSDTRTVEHFFGSTQVPADPKRVVTVGYTDDQTALALGVTPVGMTDQYPKGDGERDANTQWPWVKDLWSSTVPEVVMTNGDDAPNYEKIAALKPDLIVAVYSDIDKAAYDRLTAIAPTVGRGKGESTPFSAPWRDTITQIARALGKESVAEQKLGEIDAKFAAEKAAHPEFSRQSAVALSWYKDQVNPFSSKDVRGQILTGLGFTTVPASDALAGTEFSYKLSTEQLNVIDADRLFVINDAADQAAIKAVPAFAALRAVRDGGAVYLLDSEAPSIGAAMSQATLASMPFAVEQVAKAAAR